MTRKTLTVSGMSCRGCEQNVEDAVVGLEAVSGVQADHETDSVEVVAESEVADKVIRTAIEAAGYDVVT